MSNSINPTRYTGYMVPAFDDEPEYRDRRRFRGQVAGDVEGDAMNRGVSKSEILSSSAVHAPHAGRSSGDSPVLDEQSESDEEGDPLPNDPVPPKA